VADRQLVLDGVFTGQRDDCCYLLSRELATGAAAVSVREQLEDQLLQGTCIGPFGDGLGQPVLPLGPTPAPTADALCVHLELRRLLRAQLARRRHQDDANPFGEVLPQRPRSLELLKDLFHLRLQNNRRCLTCHARPPGAEHE